MPRVQWPLQGGRPTIEIVLTLLPQGTPLIRVLLADSGAGSTNDPFELLLDEDDCLLCGGVPHPSVALGGAYSGTFPVYELLVELPALAFSEKLRAVAVPTPPANFDGIACFKFLNRFTYGNFGDPDHFGLES